MHTTLRLRSTVLPGHRLEISDPALPEGATVDVIVLLPEKPKPLGISVPEFLESLPPGPRAFSTWEEYERHLKDEKDAWDR
jgi:hypothetical protein